MEAKNLEQLAEVLRSEAGADLDWTSLPTFGGEEPARTSRVWSWDESRLLVGTCAGDLRIVSRHQVSE